MVQPTVITRLSVSEIIVVLYLTVLNGRLLKTLMSKHIDCQRNVVRIQR